ncbi:MAG: FkbM family methyltransferase [Phormidesmis sp.]
MYKLFLRKILRKVRPLWLREKLFYFFYFEEAHKFASHFESAVLEFSPNTKLKLEPKDIGHRVIAFCGFYEVELSCKIVSLAKHGGLFVDVGANYGYFSCLWAASSKKNRVMAFEASPRNVAPLRENILNNNFEPQVEVYDVALGKETGNLPFSFVSDEQTGWGGLALENGTATIDVSVVTLDQFWSRTEHQIIDVLKIDTEGADTWVLQGAESLLRNHKILHIFFEENIERMTSLNIKPEESKQFLSKYGYRLKSLGDGQWYATIND